MNFVCSLSLLYVISHIYQILMIPYKKYDFVITYSPILEMIWIIATFIISIVFKEYALSASVLSFILLRYLILKIVNLNNYILRHVLGTSIEIIYLSILISIYLHYGYKNLFYYI